MSLDLLNEALRQEDLSVAEQILEGHQSAQEDNAVFEWELDDFAVRKLVIKAKLLKADIERKKELRDAVMQEWARNIARDERQLSSVEEIVREYVRIEKNGKPLQLDVGTVSVRKVKEAFQVSDKKRFEEYLIREQIRDQYLKEPEVDFTKAKNELLKTLQEQLIVIPPQTIAELAEQGLEYKPEHLSLSVRYH